MWNPETKDLAFQYLIDCTRGFPLYLLLNKADGRVDLSRFSIMCNYSFSNDKGCFKEVRKLPRLPDTHCGAGRSLCGESRAEESLKQQQRGRGSVSAASLGQACRVILFPFLHLHTAMCLLRIADPSGNTVLGKTLTHWSAFEWATVTRKSVPLAGQNVAFCHEWAPGLTTCGTNVICSLKCPGFLVLKIKTTQSRNNSYFFNSYLISGDYHFHYTLKRISILIKNKKMCWNTF